MTAVVLEVLYFESDLFKYFPMDGFLNGFSRFYKTRQGAVEVAAGVCIFGKKNLVAFVDQDNDGWRQPGIEGDVAGFTFP